MLSGDEWKRAPAPKKVEETRAETQARLNTEFMWGKITREEWRRRTDALSEPEWQTLPAST